MPYASDAQRRFFHANEAQLSREGVNVHEWDQASKGKDLPERVGQKRKGRKKAADAVQALLNKAACGAACSKGKPKAGKKRKGLVAARLLKKALAQGVSSDFTEQRASRKAAAVEAGGPEAKQPQAMQKAKKAGPNTWQKEASLGGEQAKAAVRQLIAKKSDETQLLEGATVMLKVGRILRRQELAQKTRMHAILQLQGAAKPLAKTALSAPGTPAQPATIPPAAAPTAQQQLLSMMKPKPVVPTAGTRQAAQVPGGQFAGRNTPTTNPIGLFSGLGRDPGGASVMGNAAFGTRNNVAKVALWRLAQTASA